MSAPQDVTVLLHRWRDGDRDALDQLMPLVYDELRAVAGNCLRSERSGHTLQTTALVNEAYLRLAGAEVSWEHRVHFFATSARLMRRVLVDHAKSRRRQKRGGGALQVTLEGAALVAPDSLGNLIEVDDALSRLAEFDSRKAEAVELLYFGGLTYPEISEVLSISEATVHRELRIGRAWLYNALQADGGAGASR